jgi:hypothetical protein
MVDAAELAFVILAAEAVCFRRLRNGRYRADIGCRLREIGDAVMRRLRAFDVCGGAPSAGATNNGIARIKPRAIGALNETLKLISYRVNGAYAEHLYFCTFAIFDDRRLRCDRLAEETAIEGDLFQAIGNNLRFRSSSRPLSPLLRVARVRRLEGRSRSAGLASRSGAFEALRTRGALRHERVTTRGFREPLRCQRLSYARLTAALARSRSRPRAGIPRRIRRAPSRPCRKRRHR